MFSLIRFMYLQAFQISFQQKIVKYLAFKVFKRLTFKKKNLKTKKFRKLCLLYFS